jgi:hypothetical protein
MGNFNPRYYRDGGRILTIMIFALKKCETAELWICAVIIVQRLASNG